MLALKRRPHGASRSVRGDQPEQDRLVAHLEHPLDLQDANDQRLAAGRRPLGPERLLGHQELAGERVGFPLRVVGRSGRVAHVVGGMKQQVSQFVGCREDPALHRDATPRVHDYGRATASNSDAEAEEGVSRLVQQQHLDAVVFEEPADVANRLARAKADGLSGALRGLGRRSGPRRVPGRSEPKRQALVETGLQLLVADQPLRHLRQNLLAGVDGGPGPEPHVVQGSHDRDQIGDPHAERSRQRPQSPRARQSGPPLGLSHRDPREAGLLGQFLLREVPVPSQPGQIRADPRFVLHGAP